MIKISDNELAELLLADDDFDKKAAEEISEMVDKEMSKPSGLRNYNKIAELAQAYAEITGTAEALKAGREERINNILIMAEKVAPKRKSQYSRRYRMTLSLMATVLVFLGANAITVSAYNKNIVSTIIHMTKGGVTVNFKETDINETLNDPYGMLAECAKYDIYPEVPYYIPEGFELTNTSNHITKDTCNTVRFFFNKDKQTINIDFERYWNEPLPLMIPSDEYNITEIMVNGTPAVVSKEDDQFTIAYIKNNTLFFMFTRNVPYDECDKIVASIK